MEESVKSEVVEQTTNEILELVNTKLTEWGVSAKTADSIDEWVLLLMIVLLALSVDVVLRRVVLRLVRNIVRRTKAAWDDLLFDHNVLSRLCNIVIPLTIYALLPLAFPKEDSHSLLTTVINRGVDIYIVVAFVRFFNAVIRMSFEIADKRPALHGRPIKGLMQTCQVIVLCIASILVIAIIIDKSPTMLLTGLGASAAVLMLIFQNSILGFVAGIQLSVNKMLKVGDWISMPSHGVDGIIEEVALTTVKIRAWDNTLQTIPPYLLINEPFDNWQAMFESGGRRIKRSLKVDITSLAFADDALIERLRTNEATSKLMEGVATESLEGVRFTNVDLYIRCVNRFIDMHPRVNHNMLSMVRQLQPTEWGLPIEMYFFTSDVKWIPHEHLQTEIVSHVLTLAPLFDIRVYQAPTTMDLRR